MISRKITGFAAAGMLALLAACGAPPPSGQGEKEAPAAPQAADLAEDSPAPAATPSAAAPVAELDFAALEDRTDPERLLRFYAAAIQAGRWDAAAAAWSEDADVAATDLAKAYGTGALPRIALGRGDTEGAAGHLFYEAPIAAEFPDGRPARSGTITLSRVNDVPGASERQLNWRIERSTLLRPQ